MWGFLSCQMEKCHLNLRLQRILQFEAKGKLKNWRPFNMCSFKRSNCKNNKICFFLFFLKRLQKQNMNPTLVTRLCTTREEVKKSKRKPKISWRKMPLDRYGNITGHHLVRSVEMCAWRSLRWTARMIRPGRASMKHIEVSSHLAAGPWSRGKHQPSCCEFLIIWSTSLSKNRFFPCRPKR